MGLWSRYCLLLLLLACLCMRACVYRSSHIPVLPQVPAALAASGYINMDSRVLDCTGCPANDMVPNLKNCHNCYLCSELDAYYPTPFCCSSGEVFNITFQSCVPGDTSESCLDACVYDCAVASCKQNIPSFSDCHIYYECFLGVPGPAVTCPASTPFFDGDKCQVDKTRCCHCHAYCYEETSLVAHPLDCRKYYMCLSEGNPTISLICPEGEYFDEALKRCSPTASCVTQCTNVVGEDGCIDPYTCMTTGFIARCPSQCTPDYYHCTEATGTYQEAESCDSGTVFHPYSHVCVTPDKCP